MQRTFCHICNQKVNDMCPQNSILYFNQNKNLLCSITIISFSKDHFCILKFSHDYKFKTCLDKCSIEYMYYVLSIMYQKIGIWFYLNCAMNKLIIQKNVTKFINVHAFTTGFHILIIFILFNSDKSFSDNRFINVFSNIYSSVIFFLKFFSCYYDISHLFQPIDYVVFSQILVR